MKKKIAVACMMAGMMSVPVVAEETTQYVQEQELQEQEVKEMDPADLTRVYREFTPTISADLDVRLYTKLTGAWSKDIAFAAVAEGVLGSKKDEKKFGSTLKNGRLQYFQVHNTGLSFLPRAGFSLDYIHTRREGMSNDQLYAAGALFKISGDYTGNFRLFPNIGYANGKMLERDVDGVMANLFVTRYIGDTGGYIQFWPEYFNVSGDGISAQSTNFHVITTVPMRADKSLWFYTKAIYENTTLKLNGVKQHSPATTSFNIGIRTYF